MSENLLPCPLCGGKADYDTEDYGLIFAVWCPNKECMWFSGENCVTYEVWQSLPRPTPPDEVARVVREMKDAADEADRPDTYVLLGPGLGYKRMVNQLRLFAARLSHYTPGETSEVRLLRELRRKAEAWRDACQAESGQAIAGQGVCEVLDALKEGEGRDE